MVDTFRPWLAGLAVIVTALCAAPAQAAGARGGPIPGAGWHGRPIERPRDDASGAAIMVRGTAGADRPLRIGAGFARPGGSPEVRQVQHLLRQIGYRPGPVDGLFGRMTRASVQWFQIKHGLRPTGVVNAVTRQLLKLRAAGGHPPVVERATTIPAPDRVPRLLSPQASPAGSAHGPSVALVALAAACAAAALLAAGAAVRRGRRRTGPSATAPPGGPAPRPESASPARLAPRPDSGSGSVVAYAVGRDRGEVRARARAIEEECAHRGWVVTRLVREGAPRSGDGRGRPGLALALDALAHGAGTRLVVCRLADVGRTRRQLGAVFGWCERSSIDLVALDVGLDTGTEAGRRAVSHFMAAGGPEPKARARPGPEPAGLREPLPAPIPAKSAAAAET